jgi:hypothetical protein
MNVAIAATAATIIFFLIVFYVLWGIGATLILCAAPPLKIKNMYQ